MAYTKQTWADLPSKTTPINATRLGHIEDGIFNAAQTADTAASTAGTAAANVGIVSGKVETLTERVNGLDTAVSNKVDKVAGKGLSTNDYDDTDKGKVDSLGTASTKNSTSVVTESSDLVESGAVKDIVGWGNKNNLSIPASVVTQSKNGIDFTFHRNSDGAVTKIDVIGTATSDSRISWLIPDTFVQGETYKLTGWDVRNITQGKTVNFAITFVGVQGSINILNATDTEKEYTCNKTGYTSIESAIFVQNGTTIDATLYPMNRKATVIDPTFEPYHASVEETLRDAEVVPCKNLVESVLSGCSIDSTGGITYDGSYNIAVAKVKNGVTYVITTDEANAVYGFFTSKPVPGSRAYNNQRIVTSVAYFSSPIDGYVAFRTSLNYATPQLEVGSQATAYEPYYVPLKDSKCDNSVIAPTENGTIVQKSGGYAVGSHAIRNRQFITWKNAKAQGETINDASDYTAGDVADAITKILTQLGNLSYKVVNTSTTVGMVNTGIYTGNQFFAIIVRLSVNDISLIHCGRRYNAAGFVTSDDTNIAVNESGYLTVLGNYDSARYHILYAQN